jgi:O-antigen/teichoic acid export membrane protein
MLKNFRQVLARRQNIRAHFWQSLANYTQAGGGMLLGIVLARLLEPSVFGEFVSITASLGFLMIPVSFSTAQLLVSDAGKTPDLFTRVWGLTNVVCLVKALLVTCYVAYWFWSSNHTRAQIAALVGIPLIFSDYLTALRYDLEGRGLFKPNFLAQVLDTFAQASVSITLVLKGYGIYGLACGGLVGVVMQGCYYGILSGRDLSPKILPTSLLFRQMQTGFWLWLGNLASGWYFRIDKILLGFFASSTQLGLYTRAMNYGPVSHILLNSLATNATVRALSAQGCQAGKKHLFYKTIAILIGGGIINGIFWTFTAETLVPLVFGLQWSGAIPAFKVLGWLGVPYALAYGSSTLLLAVNRYSTICFVHLTGLLLMVISMVTLGYISCLDSYTASLAFTGSLVLSGLFMLYNATRSLESLTKGSK